MWTELVKVLKSGKSGQKVVNVVKSGKCVQKVVKGN